MAKDTSVFEGMMSDFGIDNPRQGFGLPGLMIGRDSQGNPGMQVGGKFVPFSEFKEEAVKDKTEEDDDETKKPNKPRIRDVDYTMKGKQRPLKVPTVAGLNKTMKKGGIVRGSGKAMRGCGRGKMV